MTETIPDLEGFASDLGLLLVITAALYVYVAACLSIIARKTGTPGGWMAWVPVANLILMARLGGRPGWWGLLCLVPLLGLVIIVMLWMGIARVREKPSWMGILIIVPVMNMLLPAMLAAGGGPAASGPAPSQRGGACAQCGMRHQPGEAFCGECGAPLGGAAWSPEPPPMPTSRPPRARQEPAPAGGSSGAKAIGAVAVIGLILGGLWWINPGSRRTGAAPELPKRMAGTIKEFPVDTDPKSPARPTGVISHDLRADPRAAAAKKLPAGWLPPGVTVPRVQPYTESLTSARYSAPGVPGNTYVTVMRTDREDDFQAVSGAVTAAAPGAGTTRATVQSPTGSSYDGVHVRSGASDVYVLHDLDPASHIVILVYSPTADSRLTAERLASNAGNGNGLADYPETQDSLASLAAAPPGLSLEGVMDYDADEFFTEPELQAALGGARMAEQARESVRQFMPVRVTVSQYRDAERREYLTYAGDYGSPVKAWGIWNLARTFSTVAGVRDSPGAGLTWVDGAHRFIARQSGPRIVLMTAPAQAPPGTLEALAQNWR